MNTSAIGTCGYADVASWKGEYTEDKISAYQTLYECLVTVAKLAAPIAPFFTDWLYRLLNGVTAKESHTSVHLAYFPEVNPAAIDKDLEERMSYAQRISSLALSLRKKEKYVYDSLYRRSLFLC